MNTLLDYFILLIPSIIASIAVCYSVLTLQEFKKSQQFNTVNTILGDINELEGEIPLIFQLQTDKKNNEQTDVSLSQLLSRLFNKLDWLSYLVNDNQINDESLKDYVIPTIQDYYNGIYTEYATDDMKKESEYKEFKKLCE